MNRLRILFKIPGPKDLGMSSSNTEMPSRCFENDNTIPTWEDYYEKINKLYPIRSKIIIFLEDFFFNIRRKIRDTYFVIKWWFTKPHLLDLRLATPEYQSGYLDPCQMMLYANFAILKLFLDARPYDLRKDFTEQQIEANPSFKRQQQDLDEARALWHWWSVERIKEIEANKRLTDVWSSLRSHNNPQSTELLEKIKISDISLEEKTNEMLIRLLKIRPYLWT